MSKTKLKGTDFMVGDWVQWKDKFVQIATISGIMYSFGHIDVELAHCGSGIIEKHNLQMISPISLTSEILERNAFELRDYFLIHRIDDKPYHYDFKLKNGGVFSSEGYTLECGIYHLTIRYVHELQHALRLCGLNDLADDFKLEE